MKQLEEQYINDSLTPEGLKELRGQINSQTDSEISDAMHNHWMDDEIPANADEEQLLRMKKNVDDRLHFRRARIIKMLLRGAATVAALLIPTLLITSIYLYNQNTQLASKDLTFTTGKGERATVALPDGTEVTLNYDSRLLYSPKKYNQKERRVNFEGEAWFNVAKNPKRPFLIDADRLQVKVLGTKFDLSARKSYSSATLTLEQGSVLITSLQTKDEVTLSPGQTATLDYATGKISVSLDVDVAAARSWQKGLISFHNNQFKDVIAQIDNIYDVNIAIDSNIKTGKFTGALPMNNLEEALTIVCKAYGLKYAQNGKNIRLYAKH